MESKHSLVHRDGCGKFASKKKSKYLAKFKNLIPLSADNNPPENEIGRRIIDISYFGRQFDKGCEDCGERLGLTEIVKERQYGLCSLFYFKCTSCGNLTKIYSSKPNAGTNISGRMFSVNVKAAIAMIDAGVGPTHVNTILATLGLPQIDQKNLKKAERKVGPVLEKNVKDSCAKYMEREIEMTIDAAGDNAPVGNQSIMDHQDEISFEEAMDMLEFPDHTDCKPFNEIKICDNNETTENMCEINPNNKTSTCSTLEDTNQNCKPFNEIKICDNNETTENMCEINPNNKTSTCSTLEDTNQTFHNLGYVEQSKTPHQNSIELTVSQDAAWPKRGKAMNSLSGVGHVIGLRTRKCLDFGTKNKKCKKCDCGTNVPHDCRKNWKHSSKSMEPAIAVQLHAEAADRHIKYSNVIGDEDSSAISKIKEKVNSEVKKYSDFTHIKRSLSNKLQDLAKTHKSLTEMVRLSMIKNFTYAVHQNKKGTREDMQNALRSIIPHMYGKHLDCGSWCRASIDESYIHNNLPYGKDLEDKALEESLNSLMDPFLKNPDKLMTSGDSQANEALNNVIFSKAPKIRSYSVSESFDFRCAAGVLQFNEGKQYIEDAFEVSGLSPRKETIDYVTKTDRKRRYLSSYRPTKTQKRRRLELKKLRKQNEKISEVKLGPCYQSNSFFDENNNDTEEILTEDESTNDTIADNCKTIYMDIETTKLGYNAEITQLSATCNSDKSTSTSYDVYILPEGEISARARDITGLEIKVENGKRNMFKNDVKMNTLTADAGISNFIQWIKQVNEGSGVILCAHNGHRFDFPILYNHLEKYGLTEEFTFAVCGVVDSIDILKLAIPGQRSYALSNIYNTYFNDGYDCHNALEDALAIAKVVEKVALSSHIIESVRPINVALKATRKTINLRQLANQLQSKLVDSHNKPIVSDSIARKMCRNGITIGTLLKAYSRDSESGIKIILSEKVCGGCRVTNRRKVIENLNNFCSQYMAKQKK